MMMVLFREEEEQIGFLIIRFNLTYTINTSSLLLRKYSISISKFKMY